MPVITIRETQRTETGFDASLIFDGGKYLITITDPFTPLEEKLLEWYFEDWITFPFTDISKAEEAAVSVKTYGIRLFQQVFGQNQAYSEYRQLRRDLSELSIEIVGKTPEFHALHWEALHDPELTRSLAIDCVMVRKSVKPAPISANVQPSPLINLLVVIARPDEEKDVGYRTISRPLIEAVQNSQLRVNVELLRPGTYEALSRHLEEKGAGYYHVIHLDMHGALMTYEQLQQPSQPNRYLYKGRYGRDDFAQFDGVKAFLAFEGETQGKVDLVEASELAGLLTGKGIPVCILNACQSGKQVKGGGVGERGSGGVGEGDKGDKEDSRETSLGSRLMSAGMQMVVAMGYSVTVSAAKLMMKEIYTHLFDNKGMTEAIRLGRRELFMNKERKAYFNKFVNLEDWLLPVVYSNQTVKLNLRSFTSEEEEKYWETYGNQYRFTPPEYGFVGRDLEILKIEKALLRHNILLLQGMGGTGKTTLLTYLREWWQTTHFVKDVFYFGYDEKAWTLTQILFDIGKQVYNRFEQAQFQTMNQAAQLPKLVAKLRSETYALILDNLESVTGQQLAIQNTLPEAERNQIKDFLARLVGGKTRVVLGSRSREEWLQATTFKGNIYQLQGLDLESRSELAEKILESYLTADNIPKMREDADFQKLMKLLAGYPLAMEVVLGNLRTQSPKEILAGLQAADVKLDVDSEDKTKSILKCVEYSHSNLSAEAQKLLLCLAPFSGFIYRGAIPNYINELQKLEPFKDYTFDKFDTAIQEAINWGLLSPIDLSPSPSPTGKGGQDSPLLRIQPVLPYFLKTKLENVDKLTCEALQEGFKNHYQTLANAYSQLMESKDAQEQQQGRFFCQLEYENLYNALQICLEKQESIYIFFCLYTYLDLIKDIRSKLKLSEFVVKAQETYPSELRTGEIGYGITRALFQLAKCYLETQNYHQAKDYYQKIVELLQQLSGVSERQIKSSLASTYHGLGIVAQQLREWKEARRNYQLALEIWLEFGDRYSSASAYHNMGIVAQELREWKEARRNYQLALEIWLEFGDRYSSAKTYHELGIVAQQLREWKEARRNYQLALEIWLEFGDRYSSAMTYHHLGIVAQELREWKEARRNHQLALEIWLKFGDRYSSAKTYHELGMVAENLREWKEARRNYQLALEIKIEFGDHYSSANTYHGLGSVAQELREWKEARRNYQLALEIKIEFGARYECAATYHSLGIIAKELREWKEARRYYQLALEIFVEFGDRYSSARIYYQLGNVAQDLRELKEARRYYQLALEIFVEFGDRYWSAKPYYQLGRVAELEEDYTEAKANLQKALEIYVEYQDEYLAAVVREALERLPE